MDDHGRARSSRGHHCGTNDEKSGDDEPVEIVPYDRCWPHRFEAEKAVIGDAMGVLAVEIHHVGSTAVPGLAAKPIVDVLVAVEALDDRDRLVRAMSAAGYTNVPYEGDGERLFFRKGTPRECHAHLVERGGPVYFGHLRFRDTLISDPRLRATYEELKKQLAVEYRHDREAYTEAKSGFVRLVLSTTTDTHLEGPTRVRKKG